MPRYGMLVATALMTLLPKLAHGTTFNFNATETSALSPVPVNFTFALDTAAAERGAGGTVFDNVTIGENGTLVPGNSVGASFGTYLSSPLFFLIDTDSSPFYTGAGSGLVFNVGTFKIADGATDGEGTLSISEASASAVPEPATWVLLFGGGLLAPVMLRSSGATRKRDWSRAL